GSRSLAASGGHVMRVIPSVLLLHDSSLTATLLVALLDEVVHQLAGAVIHLDVERLNLIGEVVEGHNGGDGHQKSERGRHQSFRNTAGNCADTRGLLRRDLLECVQNADDGAEQADEGCGGS